MPGLKRLPGWWLLGLLALIWGSNYMWIKLADRGLSPVEVTLARLVLGAAVLSVIVLLRHERLPRSLTAWSHIAVAALFGNAIPYLLFAVGEQTANSSTAGMLNATTPLWTVIAALAARHQRAIALRQAIGLTFGFAGAVLIFTPWRSTSGLVSIGAVESLAAAVSYGISYVYMDRFVARRGIGSVPLSACQLVVATAMLAIALGVTGAPMPHLGAASGASILVLGLLGTGIAYVLNYRIIITEGATIASTVTYLVPIVAIVLGAIVLSEHISATALAGIALILVGVALTRHRKERAPTTRADVERTRDLLRLTGRLSAGYGHAAADGPRPDRNGGDLEGVYGWPSPSP